MDRRTFLKLAGTGAALCVLPTGTLMLGGSSASATATRTYTESSNIFPNPERGWYIPIDPDYYENKTQSHEGLQYDRPQPLTAEELQRRRAEGITLVRKYYVLYDYRERRIPQSYLEEHPIHDLKLVRENGFKLIPRFVYVVNTAEGFGNKEASLEWILRHLDQLAPILRENYDVISHMEMGLVGYYGEWHTSMNGHLGGTWTNEENGASYSYNVLNENSLAIIEKILEVLPDERMAVIRNVYQLQQLHQDVFGRPLTEENAYDGGDLARIGLTDESAMFSEVHRGGYHTNDEIRRDERRFQERVTRFVPMVGEPSGVDSRGYLLKLDPIVELERMHWRAMNNGWYEALRDGVFDYWKKHGAYDEMSMRFGYRFSFVRATLPEEVRPEDLCDISFEVKNSGFGAPFNERLLEVVLRHVETGEEYFMGLGDDPRRWQPGETATVEASGLLPSDVRPGEYDVFVNLPDPELYGRPEYSIRFANEGVWEEFSGYNALGLTVKVLARNSLGYARALLESGFGIFGSFEKRETPPRDDGARPITIPAEVASSAFAPVPELVAEENEALVDFEDRPRDANAPLAGEYGGVEWGEGWATGSDRWGKYAYMAGGGQRRSASFRLPEGKVLKSFMLLKYAREGSVNKISLRSGGEEYTWDNPAPWWAHHVLAEDWHDAGSEVVVEVESDNERWGAGNFGIDNIVYGDPSPPTMVDFEDIAVGSALTGSHGGIDWGAEGLWKVGEMDGYGKFVYLDGATSAQAYFILPAGFRLTAMEVRKREGEAENGDTLQFYIAPAGEADPFEDGYEAETYPRIPADAWISLGSAWSRPWGGAGIRVKSGGGTRHGVANVVIGSLTYRRAVEIVR